MLQFIMIIGPGCAAAILYSILSVKKNNAACLPVIALGLAGAANFMTYTTIWLVGQPVLIWTFERHLDNVYFCIQYMGVSLVFACLTALMAVGLEFIVKAVRKND